MGKLRPSENHIYFDGVVRYGSIRRAADAFHIASSALNRRILDLEEEVGTALFERLPRGVRLTTAGELLLGVVRKSLKELQRVELEIDQLRGEMRGLVRVAVAESVTSNLLPESISSYQQTNPGVGFHVQVAGPTLLVDSLARDGVDLILTHEEPQSTAISVLANVQHQLCAYVVPEHPLAQLQRVSLADCAEYPLALPDRSLAVRSLLEMAADESMLMLRPALESDSVETLKAFARLGEAVCISFRVENEAYAPGLVPLRLSDAVFGGAALYLAVRRGRVLPPPAAGFGEHLAHRLVNVGQALSRSVA
jgi:DNA-binding transcriptional LysR family regulator